MATRFYTGATTGIDTHRRRTRKPGGAPSPFVAPAPSSGFAASTTGIGATRSSGPIPAANSPSRRTTTTPLTASRGRGATLARVIGQVPEGVPPQFRAAVAKYGKLLDEPAKATGLTGAEYLAATIDFETGGTWDPGIQNPTSGALGLGQFMDYTAETFRNEYGVETRDPKKPLQQIKGAAMHLSGKFGHDALYAGYNPGFSETDPIPARAAEMGATAKVKEPRPPSRRALEKYLPSAEWAEGDRQKVSPILLRKAVKLAKATSPLDVSSGYRSVEEQRQLYTSGNSYPVAPPGGSMHNFGGALDINLTAEQRAALPQFNLATPVANDPPHVQLAGRPAERSAALGYTTEGGAIPQGSVSTSYAPGAIGAAASSGGSPATAPTRARGGRGGGVFSPLSQFLAAREAVNRGTDGAEPEMGDPEAELATALGATHRPRKRLRTR